MGLLGSSSIYVHCTGGCHKVGARNIPRSLLCTTLVCLRRWAVSRLTASCVLIFEELPLFVFTPCVFVFWVVADANVSPILSLVRCLLWSISVIRCCDWLFIHLQRELVCMGCVSSKKSKRPPGYVDPNILAKETTCKNLNTRISSQE